MSCADVPLLVCGPLAIRALHLGKGEVNAGDTHSRDHVMMVISGRINIVARTPEGQQFEAVLGPGDFVNVRAGHWHEIHGLEDSNLYRCIFAHYDASGEPTQVYAGVLEAYR